MILRDLAAADFDSLSSLILGVYDEGGMALRFEHRPSTEELVRLFSAKLFGIKNKVHVDVVAVEGGRAIGECEIAKREGGAGELGIIVERQSRGNGVGRKLLEEAIAKAKALGVSKVFAEVAKGNKNALAFFSRLGFMPSGDGEEVNAVVMRRKVAILELQLV